MIVKVEITLMIVKVEITLLIFIFIIVILDFKSTFLNTIFVASSY